MNIENVRTQDYAVVLSDHNGEPGKPLLCCPKCGDIFVHISEVRCEQGHVQASCKSDRVEVQPTNRATRARGSLVCMKFFCESGHAFWYQWKFHEGWTQVELITADKLTSEWGDSLWRS